MQQQLKAQQKNSAPAYQVNLKRDTGKDSLTRQRAIALEAGTGKPCSRLLRRRDLLQ